VLLKQKKETQSHSFVDALYKHTASVSSPLNDTAEHAVPLLVPPAVHVQMPRDCEGSGISQSTAAAGLVEDEEQATAAIASPARMAPVYR
jgi:hypothetical protein